MDAILLTAAFLIFIGLLLYFIPRFVLPDAEPPPLKRCYGCRALAVEPAVIDYSFQALRDGELKWYTIKDLKIPVCRDCGAKSFTIDVDNQIEAEYLRQRTQNVK